MTFVWHTGGKDDREASRMKKHLAVLCLTAVLAAALLLAGCGKKPEVADAAAGTPPPAATPSPAPLPLRVLQPYNSRAWYVEKRWCRSCC